MLEENSFAGSLFKNTKLPTPPGIALKILEILKKPDPGIQEVADVIALDPPMSLEILKIVNSPFYGLSHRVSSVFRAVQLLGLRAVTNLALGFSLIRGFAPDSAGFNHSEFWEYSLRTALSCRLISRKILPVFAEDAFFLGLLHNIGILTLMTCWPDAYQRVLHQVNVRGDGDFVNAENGVLGFNHMQVGGFLAKSWGLSEDIAVPIEFHHSPQAISLSSERIQEITKILHLATLFVDFFHSPARGPHLSFIDYTARRYRFHDRIDVDEILFEIGEQSKDILPIFGLRLKDETEYYQIIESAREMLIRASKEFIDDYIEQRKEIEGLNQQVRTDGLSGLCNYKWFQELFSQELSRAQRYRQPLSLMMADLDDFKSVNDMHGHPAGDVVIREVANCLREQLRESDVPARYGGEEFAIILPQTPLLKAVGVAERLMESVRKVSVLHCGSPIRTSMSIGIAALQDGEDIDASEMIERADQALREAKKTGKDRYALHSSTPRGKRPTKLQRD